MDDTTKLCLKKLSHFFANNSSVDITDYFKSPYHVYPEGETFDLKFFTTPKAKGVYKIFIKSKIDVDKTKIHDNVKEVS